jgi:hypothetical protein
VVAFEHDQIDPDEGKELRNKAADELPSTSAILPSEVVPVRKHIWMASSWPSAWRSSAAHEAGLVTTGHAPGARREANLRAATSWPTITMHEVRARSTCVMG